MLAHSVGSMLRLKLTSLGTATVVNCREIIIFGGEFSAEFCTSVPHPMSKCNSVVTYFISGACH